MVNFKELLLSILYLLQIFVKDQKLRKILKIYLRVFLWIFEINMIKISFLKACQNGDIDGVKKFISDFHKKDEEGYTPLIYGLINLN